MCDKGGKKKKMYMQPDMQVGICNGNDMCELKEGKKEGMRMAEYVSEHM